MVSEAHPEGAQLCWAMKDTTDRHPRAAAPAARLCGGRVPDGRERGDSEEIFWVDPRRRGILPLDGFHLSRSLRKRLMRDEHASPSTPPSTWWWPPARTGRRPGSTRRSRGSISNCTARGHAHSVEVWQGGRLIGGLYGVRLGGAFFGESMFSRARDGSKIALAHLVARLRHGGFALLDTQFTTPHLESLGARTVSRTQYHALLDRALARPAAFYSLSEATPASEVVQLISQRS